MFSPKNKAGAQSNPQRNWCPACRSVVLLSTSWAPFVEHYCLSLWLVGVCIAALLPIWSGTSTTGRDSRPSSLSSSSSFYWSVWAEISLSAGISIKTALAAEKAVTNWPALTVDPPAWSLRFSQDTAEIRTTCRAPTEDLYILLMRPHPRPHLLKASFFPPPPLLCLIRAAHDPFSALEERKWRMDQTWVSRSDRDLFKVSYYLLLPFGVFMKLNLAENQFSQNLCSIHQSRQWNGIIWGWWVRSWDQRGWPCWTPAPRPRSCPRAARANHCFHWQHISAPTSWIWSVSTLEYLKPNHALMNNEGWLQLARRSDGFTFWQNFQRTAPACQSAETKAAVYEKARPAATHSDLSHCFDIFIWLFPAPGKRNCCLQFCMIVHVWSWRVWGEARTLMCER